MVRVAFFIFSIWFLMLPFTVIFSIYLGTISLDKQLAPMLILLGIFLLLIGKYKINKEKFFIILAALCFFLIRNISFATDLSLFSTVLWEDAIRFGYFCLPILFIDNLKRVKVASKLISINAVVGCVSGFLVALGLLALPYERFAQSRIGYVDIERATGLFSSYGDLAQHASYFLLLSLYVPKDFSLWGKNINNKLLKLSAFAIVIMGLIGCQSRSYLLSVIVALVTGKLFNYRCKKTTNTTLFNILFVVTSICSISIIAYGFNNLVSFLANLGGSQAHGTAMGRLNQYQYAFSLIKENLVFGVNASYFLEYDTNIHGIHNMWLGQLVRGGFVGIFALLGLFYMILRVSLSMLNSPKTQQYGIVTLGYMFTVFVSTLFYPADGSLFWALLGMNVAQASTINTAPKYNENIE